MSKPLLVSVPHRLGREEAARRIKAGIAAARGNYSALFTIREESWSGDRLTFDVAALGQHVSGSIDVGEDEVRLELTLPWLLAKLAQRIAPAIRKEGTLLLERK
jgi:hypothetical protein